MVLSKKKREWWETGFSAEAQAVFDLMDSDPPAALKVLMATFIDSQVLSGNFALLDCFQFYAMDTAANAVINWIGNFSNGLLVNSPVFDPFDGITGDGTTSFINTQYNATADGINISQNNAIAGAWVVDNIDATTSELKLLEGGIISLSQNLGLTRLRFRMNDGTSTDLGTQVFLNGKLYSISRVDSANKKLFEDSTEINTAAVASTALANADTNVLANDAAGQELEAKVACFYIGAGVGFDLGNFQSNLSTLITATAALG